MSDIRTMSKEEMQIVGRMASRITTASGYEEFLPDQVHIILDAVTMFISPILTFYPKSVRGKVIDQWGENLKGIAEMHDQRGQSRKDDA